jgi:hypothetical protein
MESRIKNQESRITHYLLSALLLIIICSQNKIFAIHKANAQSVSLSISPPILEVLIKPGKTITQTYKLTNNGNSAIILPHIVKYDEKGIIDDADYKGENWISFLNNEISLNRPFLLDSNTEKQLTLKISPLAKSAEENYYLALVFTTQPDPIPNTTVSSVSETIGSVLLINVSNSGLMEKNSRISSFSLPTVLDSFGPLSVNIFVENTGKTYFRPQGKISLIGPIGKAEYKLKPVVIFEGKNRELCADPESNTGQPDHGFIFPGFFIGKYSMSVKFTMDDGNKEISASKTFIALPWKSATVIILFIIILVIYKKRIMRKNAKK